MEWIKRGSNLMPGPRDLEIRSFYEYEDFADTMMLELREGEGRMWEALEGR